MEFQTRKGIFQDVSILVLQIFSPFLPPFLPSFLCLSLYLSHFLSFFWLIFVCKQLYIFEGMYVENLEKGVGFYEELLQLNSMWLRFNLLPQGDIMKIKLCFLNELLKNLTSKAKKIIFLGIHSK